MTATEAPGGAAPTPDGAVEPSFDELATAVDRAVAAVGELEGEGRERALALQAAVEAFHRPALVHIVRTLRDDPRGKELLFELVDDPGVRAVLGLHGIIRADPVTRGNRALAAVRPYLRSHGGDVELVRIEGGTAYVRLHGSCNGCSMSAVTLRDSVEEALVDGVDEIERIEELTDRPTTAFIPLADVGRKQETGWVRGPAVADLAEGTMLRFDLAVDRPGGDLRAAGSVVQSFVATSVDRRIAVFRNECAHQGRTLDGGLLDDGVLTCPWHGFRFDASTGECLSAPGAQLVQVPTRIDEGHVWIRPAGD